ncbi:MAG: (d)CMP kinase, partial [Clostridia bacterium]|nr:(d)CMP kinase [Clostridia bacterium]
MIQIAIDGPSGAGKSTLAKELAKKLGFVYVDTGALYRAVGLYMFRSGLNIGDSERIIELLNNVVINLEYDENGQKVLLCGEDVSREIRYPEISMWASYVSSLPEVRSFLLGLQKNISENNNVIMDGRDIGTVIMPNAQVKIFLVSSPEARARRRFMELKEKGIPA